MANETELEIGNISLKTLKDLVVALQLKVLTDPADFATMIPGHVYASDLLSCVMTSGRQNGLWLTLQSHINIVAVAALLDLCAVIITENSVPDPETIEKANQQGVTLLLTNEQTYHVAGKLWELGFRQ
jgi:hypothetical protein